MGKPIVRICKVAAVDDLSGGDRILVDYVPEDNDVMTGGSDRARLWAFPLLPKMFHMKPRVGEAVFVFTENQDGNSQRYYIGPIISQLHHMDNEPFEFDATKFFKNVLAADPNPEMDKNAIGAYPKSTDIALMGRKNTDLILSDNDSILRAGVRFTDPFNPRKVTFNNVNPSFLKLKYHNEQQQSNAGQTYQSTATIVADKINLISTKSSDPEKFDVNTPYDLINDETMKKIIDKAHQIPYGDILIEFLDLFRRAFINHQHPFMRKPPCVDDDVAELQSYDLNKIPSKHIRIN